MAARNLISFFINTINVKSPIVHVVTKILFAMPKAIPLSEIILFKSEYNN